MGIHVLAALDSFKGTLSSLEAGRAVARGLVSALPGVVVDVVEVSDGGEGFMDAFLGTLGGSRVEVDCRDPLGRPMRAAFLRLPDGSEFDAVIEMASSSGLTLVPSGRRDVMASATWGVGDQIRAALDRGARRIVIGAGGSATCDGGTGMLEALGVRLLDDQGREVAASGASMIRIASLDDSRLHPGMAEARFDVASDVLNPMVGDSGAARTFGPQKGATAEQVELLERGLESLASVMERDMGVAVSDIPGGGAAGGLAAALVALGRSRIRSGFEVLAGAVGLEERIRGVDIVVTGEGSMDSQTRMGKLPWGIARMAREQGRAVVAFCGRLDDPSSVLVPGTFARIWDLTSVAGSSREAMRGGSELLARVAASKAGELSLLAGGA